MRKIVKFVVVIYTFFLLSCVVNITPEKEKLLTVITYGLLKNSHYEKIVFNQKFAERILKKYLESLDYGKRFLYQSDVEQLKKLSKKLPEQIKKGNVDFFEESYNLIIKRQEEAKSIYQKIINSKFNIESKKTIINDPKKLEYAKNKKELTDYWRKLLTLEIIQEIDNRMNNIEKRRKKSDTVKTYTPEELLPKAIKTVKKNYDDYFNRLEQLRKEDFFAMYINSITQSADPHSQYFAPKIKEDFDINMSGELEGIGATLSQRYGQIKVVNIVIGGPAWKQGELEKGDIILKVAQEGKEPVSISNMRLDDAVSLIRGPKGTKVTLTIQKVDGTVKDITIVRDKILIEETFAKSVIIEDSTTHKRIAYIFLPSFYVDVFKPGNGRRCSNDIKKELKKIRNENVDGIIIDLRNNGGGSLQEVVKMAGFFIKKGPIVQVRDRYGEIQSLNDNDASILYDGNMLVMINQFSASASEIFSAALKDYNRAVIYGTEKTLGKGTVQNVLDLDNNRNIPDKYKPLGAFKITIQKFYRINGSSTQLKGVHSDIVFPTIYSYEDFGESSFDYALPWDEIPPAQYTKWQPKYNIDSLRIWSQRRTMSDSAYIITKWFAGILKNEDKIKTIPLNYIKFHALQQQIQQERKRYNKYVNKKINLNFVYLKDDQKQMQKDTLMKYRYDAWVKTLKKDFRLKEAFNIVEDMKKFD